MTKFQTLVEIEQGGQDVADALLPRQAIVVGSDGMNVLVRFIGESSGATPTTLPTTVSGVPAGSLGWVYPIAGNKGLFVATSIAVPIPFVAGIADARFSTTEISNAVAAPLSPASITVPAGTYRVAATAIASARRSVESGEIVSYLRIGGVKGPDSTRVVDGTTPGTNAQIAYFNDVVTTSGTVDLVFGIRGGGTSGTTRVYKGVLNGTLTRIG